MTDERAAFNMLSLEGYKKGDLKTYAECGLPQAGPIRFAWLVGLAAERRRIRNATGSERYVYRGMGDDGHFFEIAFGTEAKKSVNGPMSASAIASLRSDAEREYERKLKSRLRDDGSRAVMAINGSAVRVQNPALDAMPVLSEYRTFKANRRAVAARLAFGRVGNGLSAEADVKALTELLEAQTQDMALERMSEKRRLVDVLGCYGHELFRNKPADVEAAQCAVLARTWLNDVCAAPDPARKAVAEGILGKRAVLFHKTRLRRTRAMQLLDDYDLLVNRLGWRSGIAVLSTKQREEVLKLCLSYERADFKGMEGFGEAMKAAATHVHALIVSDLFSSETLKRAYAIA